jgi:UDP:flavonoid glycosyltransferase YjiC (YdhE family)
LAADSEVLCNFAGLDHYPHRPGAVYLGPVTGAAAAASAAPNASAQADWPSGNQACAFVYVRSEYPQLEALVQALRASRWRALLHVPGLAPAQAARWSGSQLRFSIDAVPMQQVLRHADVVLSHGGCGTTHEVLAGGKPMLLLPGHMEQLMLAQRVLRLGAGMVLPPQVNTAQWAQALQQLHDNAGLARSAQAFAQTHAGHDVRAATEAAAQRCEEML